MTITPQKPWVISDLGRVGVKYYGGYVIYPEAIMPLRSFEVVSRNAAIITTLNGERITVTGEDTVAALARCAETSPPTSRRVQQDPHTLKPLQRPMPCYSWAGMIRRCYDQADPNYKWYGGSGVRVCESWLKLDSNGQPTTEGVLNFEADMGKRPGRQTLQLIDVDQPYGPNNCVWKVGREDPDRVRYLKKYTQKREQI